MDEPTDEEKRELELLESTVELQVLSNAQDRTLYHYTDAVALVGIVQKKKLWASHFRHMNDRSEFETGQALVDQAASELEASEKDERRELVECFRHAHRQNPLSDTMPVFVASFSECSDLLSQWRGYAAGGSGFSMGFNPLPVPGDGDPQGKLAVTLLRVEYEADKVRQQMLDQLRRILNGTFGLISSGKVQRTQRMARRAVLIMLRQMAVLVARAKHRAFEEEREWRIIAVPPRTGSSLVLHRGMTRGVIPYVEIPLEDDGKLHLVDLVVGPLQDPVSGEHGAKSLLESNGLSSDIVRRSEAPFRG